MPSPSYELSAVHEEDGYRVTVEPKHGKTVTLYVVQSTEKWRRTKTETVPNPGIYRRYKTVHETGEWWYVKTSPEISDRSPGYITRHRSLEEAAVGANRRARAYGRACSTPLQKKAKR